MTRLEEGKLVFSFNREWVAVKYDDHAAYRKGIAKLDRTTAVDFVGVYQQRLYLIEVKDIRGHRIENKYRDFAIEVAHKVRDSIAGLCGATRRESELPGEIASSLERLPSPMLPIRIVLWLEEDPPRPVAGRRGAKDLRGPGRQQSLSRELEQRCRWLGNVTVIVESMASTNGIPGVEVQSLSRAP